jgi:tetratricopeptide (TPR) repeat protein
MISPSLRGIILKQRMLWLGLPGPGPTAAPVPLVMRRAQLHELTGQWDLAESGYQHCLAWGEKANDDRTRADALTEIAWLKAARGVEVPAFELYRQALFLYEGIGDQRGQSRVTGNMGNLHWELGELDLAMACYQKTARLCRQNGDRQGLATSIGNMGNVHSDLGNSAKALACYRRRLALAEQAGDRRGASIAVNNIGIIHWSEEKYDLALDCYQRYFQSAAAMGDKKGMVTALSNVGKVLSKLGRDPEAAECFRRKSLLAGELGSAPDLFDSELQLAILAAKGKSADNGAALLSMLEHYPQPLWRARVFEALLELTGAREHRLMAIDAYRELAAGPGGEHYAQQLRNLENEQLDIP